MPQSTLLSWLSKGQGLPVQTMVGTPANGINEASFSTPPASSREFPAVASETAHQVHSRLGDKAESSPTSTLPANLEFRACERDDIAKLKQLNSLLLPIPYPEGFYKATLEDPIIHNITLLAIWHHDDQTTTNKKGQLIGAIRCRILNSSSSPVTSASGPMLYLSTLVLLSPYRGCGIASHMLDTIIKRAVNAHGVTGIGAHVWEANLEGLEWYRKRGFKEIAREDGYYWRLKPQSAVVLERKIGVLDLIDGDP